MRNILFFFSIFFGLNSCFSSTNEQKDLDLSPEILSVEEQPIVQNSLDSKEQNPKQVAPASVVKWQNFFQSAPTVAERKLIEQRLDRWTERDSIENLLKKGQMEMIVGRDKVAEASFRSILRLESNNLEAIFEITALYLKRKELDRAFEFLGNIKDEIVLRENVDANTKFKYRYLLALAYIARGEYHEGRRVLSDLIGIDKTFVPGYVALASSYVIQNKLEVSKFIAERGIDRGKESAALYNILGIVEEKQGLYESADRWYTKAIDTKNSFAPAMVNKANLYLKQFQFNDAEELLTRALMFQPGNVEALVSIGIVRKKNGNFDGAKAAFLKAIDLEPENAIARFNLGVLMLNAYDRPNEAIRLFNETVQISKENRDVKRSAENYIREIKDNMNAL